jgi:hypothetical protein
MISIYFQPFINCSAGDGDVLRVEDDEVRLLRHGEDQLLDTLKREKNGKVIYLKYENLEYENLEYENLEYENLEYENLEYENLEYENLEYENLDSQKV